MKFRILHNSFFAFAVLLVAFTVTGCVNESFIDNSGTSQTGQEVTITVNIPGQKAPSLPAARSIDGGGGEAKVVTMDILVFQSGTSDGAEVLSQYVEAADVTIASQSSNSVDEYKMTFKAMLATNANASTVMLIANMSNVKAKITEAVSKKVLLARLSHASVNSGGEGGEGWKWNANSSTDYTPIPMYGEYLIPIASGGIKKGMKIVDVPLTRMLARIDVENSDSNFTLTDVYVVNYNTAGYIAPAWSTQTGAIFKSGDTDYPYNKNKKPMIPATDGKQVGEGSAMHYAYPAPGGLVGEIYTYEAEATTGAEGTDGHTHAACIIIKGRRLLEDTQDQFYRIDFTSTTDAAGKSPEETGFDPATVQYMPLYRNHRYAFDITKVKDRGYTSFEDALKSLGINNNLKVSLLVVDESQIKNIVFNGKHFLGIGEDAFLGALSGDIVEIPCLTNYAYGWQVDTSKGINGIKYVTGAGWLEAVKVGQEIDKKANLKLTTKAGNSDITPREALVYLKAGTLVHEVKVTQRNLHLKIVDGNGNEITELLFSEGANTSVTPQTFTVQWGPATLPVTITNTPQGTPAFPGGGSTGVPVSGTLNAGTGSHSYTIQPTAITQEELNLNPFVEKKSLLNFSVSNDRITESKNILLRQMVYNLVVDQPTSFYRLDGSTYTLRVRSNTDWKIKSVTEQVTSGTGPLLNLAPGDKLRTTTTGSADTSTGSAVTFRVANGMHNNLRGSIIVVFESPAGLFSDVSVPLELSGEYYPVMHSGWAGSNIYWDGSKLTFDDVGDHSQENYQGVFFQWGSLWGIAPNGSHLSAWSTNITVYKLSNGVHSASNTGNGWNSFPRVSDINISSNPPSGKSYRDRHYLYEITDGSAGIGDICKYLTEQAGGSIHGKKWRMPTAHEFEASLSNNYSRSGSWAFVTSDNAAGLYQNPSAPGYRKNDVGTPFFPPSGRRDSANGLLDDVGNNGFYWSGSPKDIGMDYLYLASFNASVGYSNRRSYCFSVRCVAE